MVRVFRKTILKLPYGIAKLRNKVMQRRNTTSA